jgi:CHASE3 domain sensor protein
LDGGIRRSALVLTWAGVSLLVVTGSLAVWSFVTYRETVDWVDHTREVITASDEIVITIGDAETGQRGFVITGNDNDLAAYRRAAGNLPAVMRRVRELTASSPHRRQRRTSSRRMASTRTATSRSLWTSRRSRMS